MCGIVGYIGNNRADEILIEGLRKLEYRGYDSSGIALADAGKVKCIKTKGRIDVLAEKVGDGYADAVCGIGHTRWATHGEPSDRNSHPHTSCDGKVTLVHNGIIENYIKLKRELTEKGITFKSETDTECAVNLIADLYDGNPTDTLLRAVEMLTGSYAFAVIFSDHPYTLYAVKKDSPLILGVGEGENFIASDIPAILKWTRRYIVLNEGEIAEVKRDSIHIVDRHRNLINREIEHVEWNVGAAEKSGFPHFMLKEIFEQPSALKATISPRINNGKVNFSDEGLTAEIAERIETIHIVACGSALHTGIIGKTLIERLAGIPVDYEIASEFRYRDPIIKKNELVLLISQSGETADTLAALRLAKERGALTVAIVNVVGSSIAREADISLFTHAGPEIAVATTKAYSAQVAMMELLAIYFAQIKGTLPPERIAQLSNDLTSLPSQVENILPLYETSRELAEHISANAHVFFIGRGLDYCVAHEGSLKLKEISYIHSEAYAAVELKHGTIYLVYTGTPVIEIATQRDVFDKMVSNIKEVKCRGAFVLLITRKGWYDESDSYADQVIELPEAESLFMPSLVAVICQILAYNTADIMGCDIDKPRNLAKSVTVE
ncbi:MAG: glutamine--fructose-6-phosphate transaminase (isomerizing) [Clostridia bacterium]|nr:glutamine--fructose-6-phosphate transaminase (isomerizing) [Clostridia bacterium]